MLTVGVWRVFRSGDVYLALDCRPFSYHLMRGDGTPTDAPRWPRLKTPATYYAFVGPTEDAVQTLIRLTLERYHNVVGAFLQSSSSSKYLHRRMSEIAPLHTARKANKLQFRLQKIRG